MKTINYIILATFIITLTAFSTEQVTLFEISKDFSIKFAGTEVEGVFKSFSGDIQFDEEDLASSKCLLKIEVNSINTGNGMKNKHAKSDKWFDAKNYPNIEFQSNIFSKTETGYVVTGIMKIHGVENEISIPFTFNKSIFNSTFTINRLDFKVGTMDGSSKKVSNEIKLDISIPVTKK